MIIYTIFIGFLLASQSQAQYKPRPAPIHGYVNCPDQFYQSHDAWKVTSLSVQYLRSSSQSRPEVRISGDYHFVNCVILPNGNRFKDTYFQIPSQHPEFDPNKRRVLMFSELKPNSKSEKRRFYAPISTTEDPTLGRQIHHFEGVYDLKTVLADEYDAFLEGQTILKSYIIRTGHPEVKRPDHHFEPHIKKYGLSWGIERVFVRFSPSSAPEVIRPTNKGER
ncbi:MAG: hypothetical protein IT289_00265 [Oligoflexia bacterium]|nr:hypothetical protein [Oligoflexia bacterium]